MFTLKPPRERSVAEPTGRRVELSLAQAAGLLGIFTGLLSLVLAAGIALALPQIQRASHEALMRRTNDVFNLLGEEAARDYLKRQTP